MSSKEQRRIWKSAGLCSGCGSPREDTRKKLCQKCRDKGKEQATKKSEHRKQLRKGWKAQGRCQVCGSLLENSQYVTCHTCLSRREINREKHNRFCKENGLCVDCGGPNRSGFLKCDVCREKFNATALRRVNDRRAQGVCINHPEKKPVGARDSCIDCWYKELSKTYFNSNDYADEFRLLFEKQEGKCAYTKQILIIGSTVHLDHKIPISRGGKNEMVNFQFVHKNINILKDNMTHDEFVAYLPELEQLIKLAIQHTINEI